MSPAPGLFPFWAAMAFALTVSAAAIFLLLRTAAALPLDNPGERSLHVSPRPRGGGLAVWLGSADRAAEVVLGIQPTNPVCRCRSTP